MFAFFPNVSLEASRVPGWQNVARSLEQDCPTLILDAETGAPLDHFAELDYTTPRTDERAFMIWPARQLQPGRRYIVAIRNLRDADNRPIAPSDAFASLRDGTPSGDPDVESRRDLFEDIFARIERFGIRRSELVLAWDFTVGSEEFTTGAMLFMRDDANKRIPEGGPRYVITDVEDEYSDRFPSAFFSLSALNRKARKPKMQKSKQFFFSKKKKEFSVRLKER